jgi:hypothetical protein
MSFVNRDSLTISLPICIPFICSSCLIALARDSRTMLSKSRESGHPWLLGNGFSFSPLSMMMAIGGKSYLKTSRGKNTQSYLMWQLSWKTGIMNIEVLGLLLQKCTFRNLTRGSQIYIYLYINICIYLIPHWNFCCSSVIVSFFGYL